MLIHNVGLVNTGNLPTPMLDGIVKGKLDHLLRPLPTHNLQGLYDTGERLMLQAAILALHVLPDDDEIDALVAVATGEATD